MRKWLADARVAKGLTMKQMGDALNISESYYSMIENAERQKKMDITLVAKLSDVLKIQIVQIVAEENSA